MTPRISILSPVWSDSVGVCAVCCLAVMSAFGIDPAEFRSVLMRAMGLLKSAVAPKREHPRLPAAVAAPVPLFLTLGDKLACKGSALLWAGPCPPHIL